MRRSPLWLLPLALLIPGPARAGFTVPLGEAGLVLDASAGVPRLESGALRLVGDLTLGYTSESFGVVGTAGLAVYDFLDETALFDNRKSEGGLDAWYLSGDPASALRLELRTSLALGRYKAFSVPLASEGGTVDLVTDEQSFLSRALFWVGGRARPAPGLSLSLLVGGGPQLEAYTFVRVQTDQATAVEDSKTWTFRAEAKLAAAWHVWPGALRVRYFGELLRFALTRDDLVIRSDGGGAVDSSRLELVQWEVKNRLCLDLVALELFGFAPAVYGGLEVISLGGGAGDTTLVPSLGLDVASL